MQQSNYRRLFIGLGMVLFCASFLISNAMADKKIPLKFKHCPDIKKGLCHDLFDVSFPTDQDGWACGRWGTILHTKDGGKTWVRQPSSTDYTLSSISFADRLNGTAVGDEGTIISTADGGKTWASQKSPVPYFLMNVHFATPQKGWIVTERTTILYTEDGGKNWEIQFHDTDFILKSLSFCDDLNGWTVGEYGFIYHTDDGGSTWQQQAGEFGFSEENGEIIGGNFLYDVIAVSPSTAWVVGIDGYVAKTVDGGNTWHQVTNGVPKVPLFGITAGREGSIIIGGDAFLLVTSGKNEMFRRAEIEPSITYGWVYRIAKRGKAGLVSVGKKGTVCLSENDGLSWKCTENR